MIDAPQVYRTIGLAALLSLGALGAPTPVTTIALGPQPAFVSPLAAAVVPAAHRLYVFNGHQLVTGAPNPTPQIAVIDTSSNTLLGRLQPPVPAGMNLFGPSSGRTSTIVNSAGNRVYAAYSGGGASLLVAVDSTTDTIAQTLALPAEIGNLGFNPATNKLYVALQTSASADQIVALDGGTLAQVATISGAAPGFSPLAVNAANNKIYAAAAGGGVLVIDGARDAASAFIGVPAIVDELLVNPVNSRVYAKSNAAPEQTAYVLDGGTDQISATLSSTTSFFFPPMSIDTGRNLVYSSLGDGITIDGNSNFLGNAPVYGNFSPAVNANCQSLPLSGQDFALSNWYSGCDGLILIADTGSGNYKSEVAVNYVTLWGAAAVDASSHVTYLLSPQGNSVTALDPTTLTATRIALGEIPVSIAADPVANRVYVTDGPASAAVVIDGATNSVTAKVFAVTQHPGTQATLPVGIAVNTANNRYVFNDAATAVELDGTSNAPVVYVTPPAVKGNGSPNPVGFRSAAVNPATNKMYTADQNTVYVTDLQSGSYGALAVVDPCSVGGLTVNSANNSVLVAETCQTGGRLEIYDGSAGTLQSSADLSAFIPAGAAAGAILLNAKTSKLYIVNNGSAAAGPSTEVYNAVTFGHLATVANVAGTLAANTTLNAIYGAFTGGGGGAAVIDGNTDTLSSTFGAGITVSGLAANEATNMIYVGDSVQGTVSVFLGDKPSAGAFSISGKVLGGSGAGVAGITIAASGAANATAVTDANGLYTLMGLAAGTYTVTPTSAGYYYGPTSQTVSLATTSATGVNFDALTTPMAVTGLSLAPWTTIGPGVATTATVTLNQPAPPGGLVLGISASNTKPAKFPSSVTVAAGASSANFTVQGNSVGAVTTTSITATYQGSFAAQASSASVGLTVSPTDSLHIQSATWSKSTQLLKVSATSTNPQSILQLFLASNNQLLGTFVNQGGGSYGIQVLFTSGTPASVNVKSNLGGSTGQGVTIVP